MSIAFTSRDTGYSLYAAEGDSISAAVNNAYPNLYAANSPRRLIFSSCAVSGAILTDLIARAAGDDAFIAGTPRMNRYILSVLIGHNDILNTGTYPTPQDYATALAAYLDARLAAGWKVMVGTLLPSTIANFNTARNILNPIIKTWAGVHATAVFDFASEPTMGPDAAAADTSLYLDGTHPTPAGHAILTTAFRPVIAQLF